MQYKDWILLLVPILCNGIVIFILQKIFEKRQIVRTIKSEYMSNLRKKIDVSLELHANATRLANNTDSNQTEINDTISKYVESCLDVYYYYIQNKPLLKKLDNKMEELAKSIKELTDCSHEKNFNNILFSILVNKIRNILLKLKMDCVKC